jgi:divalent metal cation (Fe/Co/Zn/Cd) transporter
MSLTPLAVVLKTLTLALGGSITYFSHRAFRRTGSNALRALTVGFGIVTLGALLAGVVDQFSPVDPSVALVVESLFTAAGFAVILYSLYVE